MIVVLINSIILLLQSELNRKQIQCLDYRIQRAKTGGIKGRDKSRKAQVSVCSRIALKTM